MSKLPPLLTTTLILILITLSTLILYAGKRFLFPLAIALTIWFLILILHDFFTSIPIWRWTIPSPLAFLCSFASFGLFLWLVVRLIHNQVLELIVVAPVYQERLQRLSIQLFHSFGIEEAPNVKKLIGTIDFVSIFSALGQTLTDIASNAGTIAVYLLFLLLESTSFRFKLSLLFQRQDHSEKLAEILANIYAQIRAYFKIKTLLSLITAILSYIILSLFSIDFALFWSFLIFLLNFIPTIGSIIATALPCLISLVQYESFQLFLSLTTMLTLVQIAIGNIIEPHLMGRSFNLSGLVLILSLFFWGELWGITGMILSVPILVIARIIFANFDKTRNIAILLSEKGVI